MCDTFYVKSSKNSGGTAFFAKNSDRDSNEPQCMVYIPAGSLSKPGTYVTLPPYTVKNDVWLSKPSWIWGAEMGVNSKEVCIGNEATFNKVSAQKTGVLGMDHLRIALEQASSAREALNIIIQNTLRYGQGGNGGFEHPLYYANSYLIVDRNEGYVLDTVGKYYAFKRLDSSYNISNKLSIGADFTEISPELKGKVDNFQKHFINPLVTHFSGAYNREKHGRILLKDLVSNIVNVMAVLQNRATGKVSSMSNINLIAGGLISSQTTASLVYDYDRKVIWCTEGPDPEIQLFKPLTFNVTCGEEEDKQLQKGISRWKHNNLLFRTALSDYMANITKLYPLIVENQKMLLKLSVEKRESKELFEEAYRINHTYIEEALRVIKKGPIRGSLQFRRYWNGENKRLIVSETDTALKEQLLTYLAQS